MRLCQRPFRVEREAFALDVDLGGASAIGLAAAAPFVAGVVGARKYFYDVWGDVVNVASRMETTDVEGKIEVPNDIDEPL